MATFHFDLVSPEKLAFSGEVDQVDVPGVEGDFGVLAGHAPVVAAVRPGILTITAGGTHQKVIVLGGLAEMSENGLTVLADVATSLEDVDRAQFAETIAEMEAKLAEKEGSELDRGHRAAGPLQEHPAGAHFDGYALSPGAPLRGFLKAPDNVSARHPVTGAEFFVAVFSFATLPGHRSEPLWLRRGTSGGILPHQIVVRGCSR